MSTNDKDAFVKKYFAPYLNVMKFCAAAESNKNCFSSQVYKKLNGSNGHSYPTQQNTQLMLADGTGLNFNFIANCIQGNTRCLGLQVDVNGHSKPNVIGLDLFSFKFYPQIGEFFPDGIIDDTRYDETNQEFGKFTDELLYQNCSREGEGWACPARIIKEGFKMNY